MPPAARITDMHTCPAFNGPVPHVGGPIIPPCCVTVITGGQPQARITDKAICVGPLDMIVKGSATVLVGGLQAARIGDMTAHGGVIVTGCPTVIIGDAPGAGGGGPGGAVAARGPGNSPMNADTGNKADGSSTSKAKPTAVEADKAVLEKFGNVILESAKKPSAASGTELQSDVDFKEGLKKRHPKIEKTHNIDAIYGESYQKKIFVNKDKEYAGTLYHEDIHHYSSDTFKKDFGKYNGVSVNEGVTEYFTRQVTKEDRSGHYDTETKVAEKLAEGVGEDTLKKAYFQGDDDSIKKIKAFLDKDNAK
jgi:uncharacterized Zn-binding protein involved in type VI secretion